MPADTLIKNYFVKRRYAGSKDRRAIKEEFFNVMRQYGSLNRFIKDNAAENTNRLLILTYLLKVREESIESITDLFNGDAYSPAVCDDAERVFLSKMYDIPYNFNPMDECPTWLIPDFEATFPETTSELLAALSEKAPVNIRVNTLKSSPEVVIKQLSDLDITANKTSWSGTGLSIENYAPLVNLESFKNGDFEIQDEGSQLIAALVAPEAEHTVIDYCAGAGGKTLALSALMQNQGKIIASDIDEQRLNRSDARVKRAGAKNIEFWDLEKIHSTSPKADRVLIDAPCSGTGRWRRNPEAKWQLDAERLDELCNTQAEILNKAKKYVKPGGWLVYATCSVLKRENAAQIEKFIEQNPEFSVLDYQTVWTKRFPETSPPTKTGPFLELTPAEHQTDGFFVAILSCSMLGK